MFGIENKILYGSKVEFEPYAKGLGDYFFDLAEKYGDNICQINSNTDEKETYTDINIKSIRLAINLQKLGVTSEDTLLNCCNIGVDVITFLSTLYIGAKYASLSPTDVTENWIHCINNVQPTYIFVEESLVIKIEKCIKRLNIKTAVIVLGNSDKYYTLKDFLGECEEESNFRPKEVKNIEDIAMILFSSGTTDLPKGICFSHCCVPNLVINAIGYDGTKLKEVLLTFSGTHWISGLIQLAFLFHTGSQRIIVPIFDSEKVLQLIEKYKITFIFVLSYWLEEFLSLKNFGKYDISTLKIISSAGEHLSVTSLRDLRQLFKNTWVFRQYGLTETAANGCNFDYSNPLSRKLGSVGIPMRNIELKVVDRKSGEAAEAHQVGEICIKSPFRMVRYLNKPDLQPFDKEGFFKSGDLGYYDEDGCVYLLCRISDVITYKEREVYPIPLENILKEISAVKEVAVFGLPHETDGQRPAVCIVLKENQFVTEEDIYKHVAERVEYWQALKGGIQFVKALPRCKSNDKIMTKELQNMFYVNKM